MPDMSATSRGLKGIASPGTPDRLRRDPRRHPPEPLPDLLRARVRSLASTGAPRRAERVSHPAPTPECHIRRSSNTFLILQWNQRPRQASQSVSDSSTITYLPGAVSARQARRHGRASGTQRTPARRRPGSARMTAAGSPGDVDPRPETAARTSHRPERTRSNATGGPGAHRSGYVPPPPAR